MNAIEIRNIEKNYQGFKLDNVSFDVPKGSIVGLVGENGAGKSTIINLIMDIIDSDNGEINVLGKSNKDKNFIKTKQDIGIVIDEAYFPEILTIMNVEKILKLTFENFDSNYYFELVDKYKLPKNKILKGFSRGMKMKFGIITALCHKPKLLILDEATSGLDPLVRNELLDTLNEYTRNEENSILMSSHIVSDLEKICDYIVFIHKGKLVLFEEKDEILKKYGILKIVESDLVNIPTNAIICKNKQSFGYQLLVLKNEVSDAYKTELATLEDIIILLSMGNM